MAHTIHRQKQLSYADVPTSSKNQIMLSKDHYLSRLLTKEIHVQKMPMLQEKIHYCKNSSGLYYVEDLLKYYWTVFTAIGNL